MAETMPETRSQGPLLRAGDFAPQARCVQLCQWECGASGPHFRKFRPGGLPRPHITAPITKLHRHPL